MANQFPGDFGPIYTETNMAAFPVEPWNSYSNLLFFVIVVYWGYKTQLKFSAYPIIVLILPILLTGFIGGTMFHATRSNSIWLVMDFMPIIICCQLAAVYFWQKVTGNYWYALLIAFGLFFVSYSFRTYGGLPLYYRISFGYSSLAAAIVLPATIHCLQSGRIKLHLLLMSATSFLVAITFRMVDANPMVGAIFPMGTHFLWHIFGACSTHLLIRYIFESNLINPERQAG